jgi:hypothetical protein
VLDKDAVGLDQVVVVWSGGQLLEGRFGSVVAFDGGDAGQGADECLDTVDEPKAASSEAYTSSARTKTFTSLP